MPTPPRRTEVPSFDGPWGTFAEDLAREAMTRLHRNWNRIQGYQSPGAWASSF